MSQCLESKRVAIINLHFRKKRALPMAWRRATMFSMKTYVIFLGLLTPLGASAGEECFNPASMPAGSIVRIVAKRPPINLRKAEVMECTTNRLLIQCRGDQFTVSASNVLDIELIEKGIASSGKAAANEPSANAAPASPTLNSTNKSFWARIKSLWK
jgi:hypothetical protein